MRLAEVTGKQGCQISLSPAMGFSSSRQSQDEAEHRLNELDSIILMGPFQLGIFYDDCTKLWVCCLTVANYTEG